MQIELTKDELTIVLDGLAALPLAKSYTVFNKLAAIFRSDGQPIFPQQPIDNEVHHAGNSSDPN
jgi:hypothetical protein